MENNVFFLHQIKRTSDSYTKGIVVNSTGETSRDNYEAALQGYHAYLGAYAYGHDENTDFVSCMITDLSGTILLKETWNKYVPQPEPTPEPSSEE
jgi:aminopeptidase N